MPPFVFACECSACTSYILCGVSYIRVQNIVIISYVSVHIIDPPQRLNKTVPFLFNFLLFIQCYYFLIVRNFTLVLGFRPPCHLLSYVCMYSSFDFFFPAKVPRANTFSQINRDPAQKQKLYVQCITAFFFLGYKNRLTRKDGLQVTQDRYCNSIANTSYGFYFTFCKWLTEEG